MKQGMAVRRFIIWHVGALAVALVMMAGCGGNADTAEAASAAAEVSPGQEIYDQYCYSCHNPGLSGAPRLGDAEAWGPRIAQGRAVLLASTMEGIAPAMPQRGLCFSCSDEDLAAAVDYMIERGQ